MTGGPRIAVAATGCLAVVLAFALTAAGAIAQEPPSAPAGLIDPSLLAAPGEAAAAAAPLAGVRGQLRPRRHTILSAGLPGRIERFDVEAGDTVEAGQELVAMDCAILEADRAVVSARLTAATARHSVNRRLAEMNNISGLEVDLSRAEVAVARAEQQRIDARMRHCTVTAPFAGVVVSKAVEAFQYVAEGEPLLEIVDGADLLVDVAVPSHWLADLRPHHRFVMHIDELGRDAGGTILRTEGRVDPVSQTVRLIGVLDDPAPGVMAGMSGNMTLLPETAE